MIFIFPWRVPNLINNSLEISKGSSGTLVNYKESLYDVYVSND